MPQQTAITSQHEHALKTRIQAIPAVQTLGFTIQAFSSGQCIATMPRKTEFDGAFHSYHGGLLASAGDMAACFAILTNTSADQELTTTDLSIKYLRPCLTDITVTATVLKMGRTLCPVEYHIHDTNNKLVASGMATYMLLETIKHHANK
jgi:uncharacterized protein (TIGR00369 family)